MAAATLVLGVPQSVTLSATPGNMRLINKPTGCRYLRIKARSAACKVQWNYTGADEAAISGDYDDVLADSPVSQFVGGGPTTLGLASTTASVVVELTAMTGAS